MVFILVLLIMFITLKKRVHIIEDTGIVKTGLALLGLLLIFISHQFNVFKDYTNCGLNIIFKHCGAFLVFVIFLIYINMAFEIGLVYEDLNTGISTSIFATSTCNEEENREIKSEDSDSKKGSICNFEINKEFKRSLSSINSRNSSTSIASSGSKNAEIKLSMLNANRDDTTKNDDRTELLDLNKIIAYIHSFILEFIMVYLVFVVVYLSVVVAYSFKKKESIQENNGKWRYDCPLIKMDLISNLIEFFLLIYLTVRTIRIWNFIFVFKCVKFIGYSVIVWITTGPLLNVIIKFHI